MLESRGVTGDVPPPPSRPNPFPSAAAVPSLSRAALVHTRSVPHTAGAISSIVREDPRMVISDYISRAILSKPLFSSDGWRARDSPRNSDARSRNDSHAANLFVTATAAATTRASTQNAGIACQRYCATYALCMGPRRFSLSLSLFTSRTRRTKRVARRWRLCARTCHPLFG